MTSTFPQEAAAALRAVEMAARICRSVQSRIDTGSMEKNDRSPVTIADYASQAAICHILREAFPSCLIVAEEDAAMLRQPEQQPFLEQTVAEIAQAGLGTDLEEVLRWIDAGNHDGSAGQYWTLDPIDGTKGFLRKEQFAVSLALIQAGTIEVGALACPNLPAADDRRGVIFTAERGAGARAHELDDPASVRPIRVSGVSKFSEARVCESVESGHSAHDASAKILEILGIKAPPVRMDSQAKYGVLARGEAEIYLRLPTRKDYAEKIWDHAGGVLVIEEAGGKVTDIDGKSLDFTRGATLSANRGVVATNGLLHEEVLTAIRSLHL